jgi:hypothetical protein
MTIRRLANETADIAQPTRGADAVRVKDSGRASADNGRA